MEQEKKFYFTNEEGISEYWRRNKSTVVAIEMAKLLSALRKLTGYLGMNVGSIIWKGMKSPEETSAIILDPSALKGKYPIPAVKTDYMVGITVREAYRRIEWSEKAENMAWEKAGKIRDKAGIYKFQMFLNMAERIYLDFLANKSVLGLYAEIARKNDFKKAKDNFIPAPSLEELLYYWWLITADANGSKPTLNAELTVLYAEPLRLLSSVARPRFQTCLTKKSVLERCDYRSDLYAELWSALQDTIKIWHADRRTALREDEDEPILKSETGIND